jgi:5-methyltetrahydropteroyltriglutamate--homocysteine methyltransferase
MKRSEDRILVSHAGTLPRPDRLRELMTAGDVDAYNKEVPAAVREGVRRQVEAGIDIVNDGEYSKRGGFSQYVQERLTGITRHDENAPAARDISGRDRRIFPGYFAAGRGGFNTAPGDRAAARPFQNQPVFCTSELKYTGQELVQTDIANFKAALQGVSVEDAFLPAIAPGTIEHWLWNEHYPDDEAFLFAIADAMHEEYKAITDAGLMLQIDDPDLADGWQMYPDMTVAQYRDYADLRVAAINRALEGEPMDRVRFHFCWGRGHGPHQSDIPLREFIDILLKINAQCYSIEASNPQHAHEWVVWQDTKLPDGKILMPGVAGHVTDVIEHPELIAQRLVTYANLVGKVNVIAGTDCGIGSRVGHGEIAWAKFAAMAEGARIATKQLWGRA